MHRNSEVVEQVRVFIDLFTSSLLTLGNRKIFGSYNPTEPQPQASTTPDDDNPSAETRQGALERLTAQRASKRARAVAAAAAEAAAAEAAAAAAAAAGGGTSA